MARKSTIHEMSMAFDTYANAFTIINEQHRMVHDGMFFQASGKQTGWLDGTEKKFLIVTGDGNYPHIQNMLLNFGAGGVDFVAYEDATTSSDGSAMTVQNVNRASSNTPACTLFAEPTVTDDGDLIFTLWAPPTATGQGKTANGVEGIGQGSEWVLNANSKYLIVMTNNSGGTISWSYEFSWYEIGDDH